MHVIVSHENMRRYIIVLFMVVNEVTGLLALLSSRSSFASVLTGLME